MLELSIEHSPAREGTIPLANDLLNGVKEIGDFIGETSVRRVYYILEQKQIPAFKVGTLWKARKSEIARAYSSEAMA